MRIRIIKNINPYQAGQIVLLPKKQAELLIKSGIAVISKDITNYDLKES